jgi:hypothetical protein
VHVPDRILVRESQHLPPVDRPTLPPPLVRARRRTNLRQLPGHQPRRARSECTLRRCIPAMGNPRFRVLHVDDHRCGEDFEEQVLLVSLSPTSIALPTDVPLE